MQKRVQCKKCRKTFLVEGEMSRPMKGDVKDNFSRPRDREHFLVHDSQPSLYTATLLILRTIRFK